MKTWELDGENRKSELEELAEEYTAGADPDYDQRLADYDIYGSIAHVHALEDLGLVSAEEARKLRNCLRNLLDREVNLTSGDEDVHTKVENEITSALGELGEKLHTARSRNDQVLVDTRLFTKDELFRIVESLLNLVEALLDFANDRSDIPMVGYTHSRKAMPSSVGLWAGSFAEALLDDLLPVEASFDQLNQSPLGAGAGYGVPVKLDRELTADLLGFDGVQNNAIYVMNSRGKFEFNLLSALSGIQLDLSRLAEDLIAFSGDEFDFFDLPEPFTTGSSIMPQKENPDVLELVRGRASSFSGYTSTVFSLLHGLRSGYSRDLQKTKGILIEGIDESLRSLEVLTPLTEGLGVNEGELAAELTEEVFATDKVFELVKNGMPFRQAYRKVKERLDSEKLSETVGSDRIKEATAARSHVGGPANPGLDRAHDCLNREREKWKGREQEFHEALSNLRNPENTGTQGGCT